MKSSKSLYLPLILLLMALSSSGCGSFAVNDYHLTKVYADNCIPESMEANLVIWPLHAAAFSGCYAVDQSLYTFRCIQPAAVDAGDYFFLRGNGNNIMLERTIAIPKTLATPLIFAGSWLTRWMVPVKPDDRIFKSE